MPGTCASGLPAAISDAGVIELAHSNPVHGRRAVHRLHRQHADVGADHADFDLGIFFLQARGKLGVIGERRRAGVQHRQFVILGQRSHLLDA